MHDFPVDLSLKLPGKYQFPISFMIEQETKLTISPNERFNEVYKKGKFQK